MTLDQTMLNHLLENIESPQREPRVARDWPNLGRSVVVRVPALNGAWEEYGPNCIGLDLPRHRFVPTVDGVRRLAEAAGLKGNWTLFDSSAQQFLGSERYLRNMPPSASGDEGAGDREARETLRWRRRAGSLDRADRGDTAGFQLVSA